MSYRKRCYLSVIAIPIMKGLKSPTQEGSEKEFEKELEKELEKISEAFIPSVPRGLDFLAGCSPSMSNKRRRDGMDVLNEWLAESSLASPPAGPRRAVLSSAMTVEMDGNMTSDSFNSTAFGDEDFSPVLSSSPDEDSHARSIGHSVSPTFHARRVWSTHLRENTPEPGSHLSTPLYVEGESPSESAVRAQAMLLPSAILMSSSRLKCNSSRSTSVASFSSTEPSPMPPPPRAAPRGRSSSDREDERPRISHLSPTMLASSPAMVSASGHPSIARANAPNRTACLSGLSALALAGSRHSK
jgi:hypothetical protein